MGNIQMRTVGSGRQPIRTMHASDVSPACAPGRGYQDLSELPKLAFLAASISVQGGMISDAEGQQ